MIAMMSKLGYIGCRYAWLRESDPWRANMYHSAMKLCEATE